MESPKQLLALDPIEIRVLGSLLEKSKTTPEYYPMTLNALTLACNQKSSRNPIVQYDESTVLTAINTLTKKGLVATSTGGGSRVLKYKHNFDSAYSFTTVEQAVLCLLLLRGPLTPGEINANAARLYTFDSLQEVLHVLEKLTQSDPAFVMQLPKHAKQKEQRFRHLFCDVKETETETEEQVSEESSSKLEARLQTVEKELAELKGTVEKLLKELMG
jgi:uncharacterized protein YceH (UPF0502 family)